jgi:glycosyltransferase involved in cell wall biosynthesis
VNILIISAQFPYPPRSGVAMRVYQLARELARSHRVTLLSYATEQHREGVTALARALTVRTVDREYATTTRKRAAQLSSLASARPYYWHEVHSPRLQRAIDELCARDRFDVVQLESSFLYGFAFPPGTRTVLDEHNIEYEVHRRMCEGERSLSRRAFNRFEHARCRRFEQRCWRRVDGCLVTSEREARIVRVHAPDTPVAVVPNGVDLRHFSCGRGEVEPNTLVFNGILTYRPNLDAAHYLIEEVWPLVLSRCPEARLTVVGRAYPADLRKLRRPSVVLTGEVPDIRPYLQSAAVVGVPVRMGGGTRLKVVEGLAMGKAIVSTSLGCEGLAVRDSQHLLIADDAETFAKQIVHLFANRTARGELGQAGRALVERAYSWSLAGERVQALHRVVAAGRPDRGQEGVAWPRQATV